MKLLLFIINLLCLSFCVSNTINQETILQCLKLKNQFPNLNLNCLELLKNKEDENTNNPVPSQTIEEGVQENSQNNNKEETNQDENKTNNQNIKTNEIKEFIQKEFVNLNTMIAKIFPRFDSMEEEHKSLLQKMDLMSKEILSLKNEIKSTKKNVKSVRKVLPFSNKFRGKILNKSKKPTKITLSRRNQNLSNNRRLRIKNKKYLNRMIPKKPLPYLIRKRNIHQKNNIIKINDNKKNKKTSNDNNSFDMELLKKLLAQQNKQTQTIPKTEEIKNKVENPGSSIDEERKNNQFVKSESNLFKVHKKNINMEEEKIQHEKDKKLNDEASKLFQALKMLKNKQSGILSNLSFNKNQSNNIKSPETNKKLGNIGNKNSNLSPTNNLNSSIKKIDQNQNNDATLTEIEKQINLLNSLNTNNNSR